MVMYKTRNPETGNRMQRTQGKGKCYIPGNIAKHFGECLQTFRRICYTFWGMLPNIPGNVVKHSEPTSTEPTLTQSLAQAALHPRNHTTTSPPPSSLPPSKSRGYTNLVFFSLVTSSPVTTRGISKSPQVRFLIA